MNSDEMNWLLQTIDDPENAKRFVQAQYHRGRIPYHVMASLARDRNWTDFNGVHYHTAKDSSCNGVLTGTEVMEVRDFSTTRRNATPQQRRNIEIQYSERCTKPVASAQIACGLAPEGASAADLAQSMQEKTGPRLAERKSCMTNFQTTAADQTVKEMDVEEFDLVILCGGTRSTIAASTIASAIG
jgi:hypothetical protein